MYNKNYKLIFILLFLVSLLIPFQVTSAGQWHNPNGPVWTVSKVCRDGAVLLGTNQTQITQSPDNIGDVYIEFLIRVSLVLDTLKLEESINFQSGIPGDNLTLEELDDYTLAAEKTDFPNLVTDVPSFLGTHATYVFGMQNIYWTPLDVGKIVQLMLMNNPNGAPGYFQAIVQDCYLDPDAPIKSPGLEFNVTVGTDPDVCTSDTTITVDSGDPVYACLIVQNTGDVFFDQHTVTDTAFGIDGVLPLSLIQGTHFSITHDIVQHVGFNIDLGPFENSGDVTTEFTWAATGSDCAAAGNDCTATESASIEIMREFEPTEAAGPPTPEPFLYISSSSGGRVEGLSFADEDILTFDPTEEQWAIYFDGSDMGLSDRDVNALHILDDGNILLSLNASKTLGGITYDDSDIIEFTATSLGTTTRGSFSMYFDGSDVNLTTRSEDIDAIALLPDGDLVISTLGAPYMPLVTNGRDEDLLRFDRTQLGHNTQGTWSLYMEGSDLGLTNLSEDVWATWVDNNSGDVHFSTYANYIASSSGTVRSGDGDDILICTPGQLGNDTQCELTRFWNGDSHNLGSERIDGYSIGPAFISTPENPDDLAILGGVEEVEEIDDELDDDVVESLHVYLPWISR